MPPSPQPGIVPVHLSLRPVELIAAWRPEIRRLLLATREPIRAQRRVAVRITAVGLGVSATVTGRVVSASSAGNVHRIELAPDETRIRAVERLLEIARGAAVEYQERAPRFLATVPAVVRGVGGLAYMNTFSVSEKGCGLAWTGPDPLPAVGVPMEIRLGAGNQAASLQGVVCWTAQSGRSATVGVRFVSGAKGAWATMVGEVRRSGAPMA